jgi:hypothetical protein
VLGHVQKIHAVGLARAQFANCESNPKCERVSPYTQ